MYFIKQYQVRKIAKEVLIRDFYMDSDAAKSASKNAQLEPVPKWLIWLRMQRIRFSNLIYEGKYSLK